MSVTTYDNLEYFHKLNAIDNIKKDKNKRIFKDDIRNDLLKIYSEPDIIRYPQDNDFGFLVYPYILNINDKSQCLLDKCPEGKRFIIVPSMQDCVIYKRLYNNLPESTEIIKLHPYNSRAYEYMYKEDTIYDVIKLFKQLPNLKVIIHPSFHKFDSYDFKFAYQIAHNIKNPEDVKLITFLLNE